MKRSYDDLEEAQEQARHHISWREQVQKRVLSNALPATEVHADLKSATLAGARGCEDYLGTSHNAARAFKNKLVKHSSWPGLYWAEIPMGDPKTGKRVTKWMCFLLPHEWLPLYVQWDAAWEDLGEMDDALHAHRARLAKQLRVDPEKLVLLGLHGDGVPIRGNTNEDTLDVFNTNLPTSRKNAGVRIPFTCVQVKHALPETFAAVMELFCWSMRSLATGQRPVCRHDGTPFIASDSKRRFSQIGPGSLGARAVLAEIRGDWKWLQKLFKFPAWNKGTGFCWLCTCKLQDLSTLDTASAPWRFSRYSGEAFLAFMRSQGIQPSAVFNLPGVSPAIVYPDWMHSGDMGVAQDEAAHVFHEVLPSLPGDIVKDRTDELFHKINSYYQAKGVKDRTRSLQHSNFTNGGVAKANKLKCKAAEARALVPFLPTLAARYCSGADPYSTAVRTVTQSLADCYELMDTPGKTLRAASRKFANAYASLNLSAPDAHWHIKPKLHLFQELCEFCPRSPRLFWCYNDETFGNVCAKLFLRRGGHDNPGNNSEKVLLSWCCGTPMITPFDLSEDEGLDKAS